jgi:hypothetical protein
MIPVIMSECLAWFLVSALCYSVVRFYNGQKNYRKYLLVSSLILAFLAMTKVIFGIVITVMVFLSLLFLLIPGMRRSAKKSFLLFFFALLFCLPWLAYTYGLTGKFWYWTNSGGMSMYIMSSPYPGEYGDWKDFSQLQSNPDHAAFMDSLARLAPVPQDEAFAARAVRNIRQHPGKFVVNWTANIGRLLFSYPYSFAPQTVKSYYTILPNMAVVFLILVSLAVFAARFRQMPHVIILLLVLFLVYLSGSSLVCAYRRMFYITIPFWFLFIAFVFGRFVSFRIIGRGDEN